MPFDDLKFRVVSGLFDIAGNFISGQLTKPNYDEREKILDDYYRDAIEVTRKAPKKFRAPPPPPIPEPVQDLTPMKIEGGTACLPCVPPNTIIYANPSCKPISELCIGDKVLDRDGNWTKITNIFNNKYAGPIYDIFVKYKNKPITVTPEHPILITRIKPCHLGKGYCTPDKKTRSCGVCEKKHYLKYKPNWMKPSELFVTKWKSTYTEDKLFLMMPRITKIKDEKTISIKYYLPEGYVYEEFIYYPLKDIKLREYDGTVMNLETEAHNYIANGIILANCSRDHFSTVSGALNEALRFARKEGMRHPEVEKRIGLALDELNALERLDLSAENIVKLEGKEKDLAVKGLDDSRNLRHKIATMREVGDLEQAAAEASTVRTEFMRNLWGIVTVDGTIDKLCKGLSDEERTRCISTINQVLLEKKETPP